MKKMALKSMEVIKFTPSPKQAVGIPTLLGEDQGSTNTDSSDNPLVSGPIIPVTMPVELHLPGTGQKHP